MEREVQFAVAYSRMRIDDKVLLIVYYVEYINFKKIC